MTQTKDLIVVGAGPAGSQLAKNMAEKGLDVLVIERSDEIGKPLACSGHVSPDIWNFVSEEEKQELLQNKIKGARFHSRGKEFPFYSREPVSYVIDRVKLDKIKASHAREAGATIKTGEEVVSVEEKEDFVEVETGKESYNGKMVAGCDGASSKVRSEVGLEEPDHFYQGLLCFSDEEDSQDFVDVFMQVPEFFGWRIPRSENVEYGVAVPRGENPVDWLNEVTGDFVEEDRLENFCAGAIPIGPVDRTFTERVFLVGDAAGQTKPFTGGGIIYGMTCADIAAEEIDVEKPGTLENYDRAWREELGREIMLGRFIENTYSWPEVVREAGMAFFQGEIGVHMDRPTTLFSWKQLKSMTRKWIS